MQHTEDRECLGNDRLKPSLTPIVFRHRGFRIDPTLRNRGVPAFALPNANDPLRQREKSKELF